MCRAALLIIANKYPYSSEWINKTYIHTMDYNSSIKRTEVLIDASIWIDPKNN